MTDPRPLEGPWEPLRADLTARSGFLGLDDLPAHLGGTQRVADYQGWSNWETWNTALMIDNEQETNEAARQLVEHGGTSEQLRDWAIENVLAPSNQRSLEDAKEWNSIPEEERLDHSYEDFKDKHGDNPASMDLIHGLFGGPDVSDYTPELIDPELVNWDEIHQHIQNEFEENQNYENEDERLKGMGLHFGMPGHSDETNQMLDAWLKHHGVDPNAKSWGDERPRSEFGHTTFVPIDQLDPNGFSGGEAGDYWQQNIAPNGGWNKSTREIAWDTLWDIQRGRATPEQIQTMQQALAGQGYTPEQIASIIRQKSQLNPETNQWESLEPKAAPQPDPSLDQPGSLTIPNEWISKTATNWSLGPPPEPEPESSYKFEMPRDVEQRFVDSYECPECKGNLRHPDNDTSQGVYCEYCGWQPRQVGAGVTPPMDDQSLLPYATAWAARLLHGLVSSQEVESLLSSKWPNFTPQQISEVLQGASQMATQAHEPSIEDEGRKVTIPKNDQYPFPEMGNDPRWSKTADVDWNDPWGEDSEAFKHRRPWFIDDNGLVQIGDPGTHHPEFDQEEESRAERYWLGEIWEDTSPAQVRVLAGPDWKNTDARARAQAEAERTYFQMQHKPDQRTAYAVPDSSATRAEFYCPSCGRADTQSVQSYNRNQDGSYETSPHPVCHDKPMVIRSWEHRVAGQNNIIHHDDMDISEDTSFKARTPYMYDWENDILHWGRPGWWHNGLERVTDRWYQNAPVRRPIGNLVPGALIDTPQGRVHAIYDRYLPNEMIAPTDTKKRLEELVGEPIAAGVDPDSAMNFTKPPDVPRAVSEPDWGKIGAEDWRSKYDYHITDGNETKTCLSCSAFKKGECAMFNNDPVEPDGTCAEWSDTWRKKSAGRTFYHVTDRGNRESIQQNGIDPNHSDTWKGQDYPYVWAWDQDHYQRALDWGAGRKDRPTDIWHVNPEGLEWQPDPHAKDPDHDLYQGGWATGRIPPENLIRVEEYTQGGSPWWEKKADAGLDMSSDSWWGPQSVNKFEVSVPGAAPGMGDPSILPGSENTLVQCSCGHGWNKECPLHGEVAEMHKSLNRDRGNQAINNSADKVYNDGRFSTRIEECPKCGAKALNGACPECDWGHRRQGVPFNDLTSPSYDHLHDYIDYDDVVVDNAPDDGVGGALGLLNRRRAAISDNWVWLDGKVAFGNDHHDIAMRLAQQLGYDKTSVAYISNSVARNFLPEDKAIAVGTMRGGYPQVWDSTRDRNAVWDEVMRERDKTQTSDDADPYDSSYGAYSPGQFAPISKVAMAERTGIPEIDKLIEDFLREPYDYGDTAEIFRDPEQAHGNCQEVTDKFVAFAKARGFNAYSTDTNLEEMGYKPSIEPFGEIGFDENDEMQYGFYPEHTVASIYLPDSRFPIVIDFTATQYGYTDHPKVSGTVVPFGPRPGKYMLRNGVVYEIVDSDGSSVYYCESRDDDTASQWGSYRHRYEMPIQQFLQESREGLIKTAMAERTGDPELDKLIEEFMQQPYGNAWHAEGEGGDMSSLDPDDWTDLGHLPGTIQDNLKGVAQGQCHIFALRFAEFLQDHGVEAYSTEDEPDENDLMGGVFTPEQFGYEDRPVQGAPNHCVTKIYMPSATYMIDWTASQYGYKEFPMVQRLGDQGGWQREWTSKVAMGQRGSLPEGLQFDFDPGYGGLYGPEQGVIKALVDGRIVGTLDWNDGLIDGVEVEPQWRRRGIATAMLQEVEGRLGIKLQHSEELTGDGLSWADHVGATSRVYYHATPRGNRSSIMTEGLRPGSVVSTEFEAIHFGRTWYAEDWDLWRVDTSGLALTPDPDYTSAGIPDTWQVPQGVSPERLRLLDSNA